MSKTNRIIALITDKLKGNAAEVGLTDKNIERSRRRPAELSELPLITVRPLKEGVSKVKPNVNCPAVARALDFAVTVRCAGEDEDLDPYRNFAISTVMSDLTLGGLVTEIQESEHDWDGDGAATDADYAEDAIVFTASYTTLRNTAVS